MSNFTYKVLENNAVEIWKDGNNEYPIIFQPINPNGNAWGSLDEAVAWAKLYIDELVAAAAFSEDLEQSAEDSSATKDIATESQE